MVMIANFSAVSVPNRCSYLWFAWNHTFSFNPPPPFPPLVLELTANSLSVALSSLLKTVLMSLVRFHLEFYSYHSVLNVNFISIMHFPFNIKYKTTDCSTLDYYMQHSSLIIISYLQYNQVLPL